MVFQHAVNRAPNQNERDVLLRLMDDQRKRYMANPEVASEAISTGEKKVAKDVDPVELATLMSITRAVLNMHEFITRN